MGMTVDEARGAVAAVMAGEAYRRALAVLERDHPRFVDEIVRLTEVPSPPFGEAERGRVFAAMLEAQGVAGVRTDEAGNVLALRPGTDGGPALAVAAHLDTVFPAGTPVRVRREGTRLLAPGVGDDTRGLAVLLFWLRALDEAGVRLRRDVLFVADVGEEGAGDLRGMRHLFTAGDWAGRIGGFITVDGPEMEHIATGGIGSRRLRVTLRGPGGHSWGAFGTVNPLFALGTVLVELGRTPVPSRPRTSFCASVVAGGTSINAIPGEASLDVDLRSEDAAELAKLERRFREVVERAVAGENATRSTAQGAVVAEVSVIGDRPAGRTAAEEPLVRLATAAVAAHGFAPEHESSSTDANLPMSLGVPAIKLGSGGTGGRAHSPEEWIDVEPELSLRGLAAGLATLLAVAGVA